MCPKGADGMAKSVDPDQTAPLGAVWSGSTLFAQTCLSKNLEKTTVSFSTHTGIFVFFLLFFNKVFATDFDTDHMAMIWKSNWGKVKWNEKVKCLFIIVSSLLKGPAISD